MAWEEEGGRLMARWGMLHRGPSAVALAQQYYDQLQNQTYNAKALELLLEHPLLLRPPPLLVSQLHYHYNNNNSVYVLVGRAPE